MDVRDLEFAYGRGAGSPQILDIPQMEVRKSERLFLYGPSGCGKTTLLSVLTGVLAASTGRVEVLGHDLVSMTSGRRDQFRAEHIGTIFQMFNLVPYLSVLDNILLPVALNKARRARLEETPRDAAARLATALGLESHLDQPGRSLSVGQQQRVAAARALIGSPELIIADEPTSALDSDRRTEFLELLFGQCDDINATLILVSHDRSLGQLFDRELDLTTINRAGGHG